MAFTPHEYCGNYNFSNDQFSSSLNYYPLPSSDSNTSPLTNLGITPSLYDNSVAVFDSDRYVPPSISMMPPWFPERLGVSDMAVPVLLPASSSDTFSGEHSLNMNSTTTHQVYEADNTTNGCQHEGCESSWDETTGFHESSFWSSRSCPVSSSNNWGPQRETSPKLKETPGMKIGRYSEEERKDRILRYLKKRNQRNFNKTIKYACRKTLADKRVRVRGRFAKNNETCDDEVLMKGTDNFQGSKDFCYDNPFQMKHPGDHYEEIWLEEAITNLMYNIPYLGSSYDGSGMSVERFMS